MTAHTFDAVAFRAQFPAFADTAKYPDAVLSGYFDMATCNINEYDNCEIWGKCLQQALNLMTSHIATIFDMIASGTAITGVQTGASVDKVSISAQAPPIKTAWQAWLAKTPYGEMLWALLTAMSTGGFYIGGAPETFAFRKVGGYY